MDAEVFPLLVGSFAGPETVPDPLVNPARSWTGSETPNKHLGSDGGRRIFARGPSLTEIGERPPAHRGPWTAERSGLLSRTGTRRAGRRSRTGPARRCSRALLSPTAPNLAAHRDTDTDRQCDADGGSRQRGRGAPSCELELASNDEGSTGLRSGSGYCGWFADRLHVV